VDEAVRMSRPLATAAKVRLSVVGPIRPISLRADRRTLYQVLFNLLSNAIKFNRSPGTAEVRIARRADGGVEIVVSDTGIGVDPAIIPELFRPFRQANSEIARQFGGTGLGLSIVERLVRLHGGEVSMESEPGQGTSVMVVLPASRVMMPSRMAAVPPRQSAKRRA
jgi:signal transduction histidine kinase